MVTILQGYNLNRNAAMNESADIYVRNKGLYFVKVGNRPAQKVVVVR